MAYRMAIGLLSAALISSCSSDETHGAAPGTGGIDSGAGATTGGVSSTGGAPAAGAAGKTSTGGTPNTGGGGTTSTGGTPNTGGGGTTSAGGTSNTGGSQSTGGARDAGGDSAPGDSGPPFPADAGPADQCSATGGTVESLLCCGATGDFPNGCVAGPCGCSPMNSHAVQGCNCPGQTCFEPGKGCRAR
jgi:hypothetical protein